MFILLALLACNGPGRGLDDTAAPAELGKAGDGGSVAMATPASSEPVFASTPAELIMPRGSATVRDCYGRSRDESAYPPPPSPRRSSSSRSGAAKKSKPSSAPSAGAPTGSRDMASASMDASSGDLASASGGAAATSAAPTPEPEPAPEAVAAPAELAVSEEAPAKEAERERAYDGADEDDEAGASRGEEQRAAGPQLDWGGTLFLSNDDSMSLASAQRLLYAVKNDARISPSDVRPHELLNYFSFDSAPVPDNAVFSVHASAERTGSDSLTMALAVRGANPPRQPLDLTVLVDRSGSMRAEGRMDYLKRGLNVMTNSLVQGDRLDLVLFDSNVCVPLEDYVVGRDDPGLLTQAIADMQPRGSTNMNAGLQEAYRLATSRVASDEQERNRRVMVVTDAFLNTGSVNKDVVSEIGKAFEQHGVRMTGIGVGREFNDTMLDKLTEKGKGAYVYLGSEAVVDRVFGLGFESMTRTIAHDVRFALNLPDSLAVEKFYGEEASSNPEDIQPINYYAGTTQLFLQDLKARDVKNRDKVSLTVSWKDAVSGKAREQSFQTSVGQMLKVDRHNVRKAQALMSWTDMLLVDAMGGSGCSEHFASYAKHASAVGDDAEVAYVNGLVEKRCGMQVPEAPPPVLAGVTYKVKLDTDLPIAEVAMECGATKLSESLKAGESVAVFQAPPGSCVLSLQGNVPMQTQVEVPATGGSVRCMVRGGRMNCS